MSNACCICYNVLDDFNCLLVCECIESWVCFHCLISERWGNTKFSAHASDFDAWWNISMRCPICNVDVNISSLKNDNALKNYWEFNKSEFVTQKYGSLMKDHTEMR